jgi:hypothetical protein
MAANSRGNFRLSRNGRRTRAVLTWMGAGLATFIGAVSLINFYDEPPSSEVGSLLAQTVTAISPDQNLYLALLGFNGVDSKLWFGATSSSSVAAPTPGRPCVLDHFLT